MGWGTAALATAHCLTGCALGMVLSTALGWGDATSIAVSVVLAFLFGYALAMRGVLLTGAGLRQAAVALAADTLSIAVMEITDNLTMVAFPGAMAAPLGEAVFWTALALALAVAFVATLPVNKWLDRKRRRPCGLARPPHLTHTTNRNHACPPRPLPQLPPGGRRRRSGRTAHRLLERRGAPGRHRLHP
ncbi:DUF4396 domain-containing protein [Streptomyces sp. NPDC046727]|uniref:DUF4396 domain-containing protein n=1 Tax=Streptomyces sp. NPDC046727 TaxID=3155373 RepID=UPI0033E258B1